MRRQEYIGDKGASSRGLDEVRHRLEMRQQENKDLATQPRIENLREVEAHKPVTGRLAGEQSDR